MTVTWGGSYNSQRRPPTPGARMVSRVFRRLLAPDGSAFSKWRRPVTFSEDRRTLDALRDLHKIATDASLPRPVPAQYASVALNVGRGRGSQPAGAIPAPTDLRERCR